MCLVQKCNEKFWTNEIRRDHLIQIHLFPSNFHFFSSNNNKTIKKIKKKINKNLFKNNHNNDDNDNVNISFSTTACINSNDDNNSNNDDYNYGMINDDNVNPSFHYSSSNSINNRKQRRKEKSVDKNNENETKNPSISAIESITISSSSFIPSSTKSTTNKITVSNSLIKTNNNLIKFVDVDNHVKDNAHEIDDGARNDDDDDEMDVVTEALKKSCITVPSKIRFGRRG